MFPSLSILGCWSLSILNFFSFSLLLWASLDNRTSLFSFLLLILSFIVSFLFLMILRSSPDWPSSCSKAISFRFSLFISNSSFISTASILETRCTLTTSLSAASFNISLFLLTSSFLSPAVKFTPWVNTIWTSLSSAASLSSLAMSCLLLTSPFIVFQEFIPMLGPCIAKEEKATLTRNSVSMPSIRLLSWPKTDMSIRLWPNWVAVSSPSSTPILKIVLAPP